MKKIIISIILSLVFGSSITFAGNGFSVSSGLSWTVSSGQKLCSDGKELLDKWVGQFQPRTGTALCYYKDNIGPSIFVNSGGYTQGKWTKNSEVILKIYVVDSQPVANPSGLGKVKYKINNSDEIIASNNFQLKFTEEGVYYVEIIAEDNAINDSYEGAVTQPNITTKKINVFIDRSAPVYTIDTNNGDWINSKPSVNFKIKDTYKGKNIVNKEFTCPKIPNNATATSDEKFLGACLQSDTIQCTKDSDFTPNISDCSFVCNEGYTLSQGLCLEKFKILTCSGDLLPKNVYSYNKDDLLKISDVSTDKVLRAKPNGINQSGEFYSFLDKTNSTYSPTINQCSYECGGGYHLESEKCVNNTKVICCDEPYLSYNTAGKKVDCSLSVNKNRVECTLSSLCDYRKELLGTRNILENLWYYSTDTDTEKGESGKQIQCGYKVFDNSNGSTCNAYYYLISYNEKPYICESVSSGFYSSQENALHRCTNAPDNAYYISASDRNNCKWDCNTGYKLNGTNCEKDEKEKSTECGVNGCIYKIKKTYFKDKSCLEYDQFKIETSQKFDTMQDCNDQLDKEYEIGTCSNSWYGSRIKTIELACTKQ